MPRQYYTDLADQYDSIRFDGKKGSFLARTDATLLKELFSVARSNAPMNKMSVLDIPVGTGRSLIYLKQENIDIIGCDLTWEMLQIAQRKAEPNCLGLIQGDASTLPLPNESVDCILALRFFHLFPSNSIYPFSQEFGRILKPGGFLICSITNGWHGFGLNWVRKIMGNLPIYFLSDRHIKYLFHGWKIRALYGNYLPLHWTVSNLGPRAEALSWRLTRQSPLNRFCFERYYLFQKPMLS